MLSWRRTVSLIVDPPTLRVGDPPTIAKVSWDAANAGIKRVDIFVLDENAREKIFLMWREAAGSADTGTWVGPGTVFVLRDNDSKKQLAKFAVGALGAAIDPATTGQARLATNESTSQETSMTTLKLFRRLRALEPGQSGLVTAAELMKIEVPEPYYLLKDRAEWLRNQLPFSCDLKEGKTNDGWVFSRGPRHTSKASLQICEVGSVQG